MVASPEYIPDSEPEGSRPSSPLTPLQSSQVTARGQSDSEDVDDTPKLWVDIRRLPEHELAAYEPMGSQPEAIVGEVLENGKRYLYAKFDTTFYRVSPCAYSSSTHRI